MILLDLSLALLLDNIVLCFCLGILLILLQCKNRGIWLTLLFQEIFVPILFLFTINFVFGPFVKILFSTCSCILERYGSSTKFQFFKGISNCFWKGEKTSFLCFSKSHFLYNILNPLNAFERGSNLAYFSHWLKFNFSFLIMSKRGRKIPKLGVDCIILK